MRKNMTKPFSICLALGFACLTVFVGCKTNGPATASPQSAVTGKKFTYVIVHGAWGGGWDWKHVDQLLTADGHKVYRPTLTGQGERSHLASTNIDLDTHIQDIVNVIVWEDLHNVVLIGHSYGGMVITGVADRAPDRIRRLVYGADDPKAGAVHSVLAVVNHDRLNHRMEVRRGVLAGKSADILQEFFRSRRSL